MVNFINEVLEEDLYKKKQKLEKELEEVKTKILHNKLESDSFLSIGDLREAIKDLPNNMPVFCQLLSDKYVSQESVHESLLRLYDGNGGKSYYHSVWSGRHSEESNAFTLNLIY